MANSLYDKGREAFLNGSINWASDNIKCVVDAFPITTTTPPPVVIVEPVVVTRLRPVPRPGSPTPPRVES